MQATRTRRAKRPTKPCAKPAPVKTVYVSSSLGASFGEGTTLRPYRSMREALEWLRKERGLRTVCVRGGDVFLEGFLSLGCCGEGAANRVTIKPWGDGSPVFKHRRGSQNFWCPEHMHVTLEGLTFIEIVPWHVRLWRWLTR